MKAEIWLGLYCWPLTSTHASPLEAFTILKGTSDISLATIGSSKRRPIRRLTEYSVLSGLVTAWRLAAWPTRRSPLSAKATMEGVVRAPSEFSITLVSPPSMTATHELVVPRSIPMTLAMTVLSSLADRRSPKGAGTTPDMLPAGKTGSGQGLYRSYGAACNVRGAEKCGILPQSRGPRPHIRPLLLVISVLVACRTHRRPALGHRDHGGAQQPAGKQVARNELLHDRAGGYRRILDLHHRLMELGIERFAQRVDALDAMALQHRLQLAIGGLDAHDHVAQRLIHAVGIVRQRRQGAPQIVGDRQHVLGKALDAELALTLRVLLAATTDVLRLGQRAQQLVLQLRLLGLQLPHVRRRVLRLGAGIVVRVGRLDRHVSRGVARG